MKKPKKVVFFAVQQNMIFLGLPWTLYLILSLLYSKCWQFFVIHWISTLSLLIVYFAKILLVLQVCWLMFYDVYQISDVATDIIINRNADQRIPNTFTTHGGWIQNCSTVHDCKEKSPRIKGRSHWAPAFFMHLIL